jgi:hypothetical protein
VLGWMKMDAMGVFESSASLQQQAQAKTQAKTQSTGIQNHSTTESDTTTARKPYSSMVPLELNTINAVTWGVFPSREILTPTIIEAESFRAWSAEAYAIWSEWRRCFPRDSREAEFLERMRGESVLVNVVGHGFRGGHTRDGEGEGGGLWRILLGGDPEGEGDLREKGKWDGER